MSSMKQKLQALETNGYLEDAIPTRADNNKIPAINNDWPNHKTSSADIDNWKPGQGIGLICRRIVAIDIDIEYRAEDAEAIHKIATEILGKAPYRVGKMPKRLLLYRLEGMPIKKKTLKFEKDGIKERIEILGEKQHFLCYGTHPDTGRTYEWPDLEICDIHIDDLVKVSEQQLNNFIERSETYLLENGYGLSLSKASGTSPSHERKPIGHVSLVANDIEVLVSALWSIPNDLSYDDWIRLVAAYKAAVGGDDANYPVIENWSLQWPDNTPKIVREKWESIKETEAGAGTIFHEAKKRGWKFPNIFNRKAPYKTANTILDNCFSYEEEKTLVYTQDFYFWKDGYYQVIHEDQIKK